MDGKQIIAFVESVQHVFGMMLQCEVQTNEPTLETEPSASHDVSAVIGFSGDMTGAIVIGFPAASAERIASLMVGSDMTLDNPDLSDALGELANMVAGNAKSRFAGMRVSIACPSVVIGAGHQVFSKRDTPRIKLPCDCECGPFDITVSLKANAQAAAA